MLDNKIFYSFVKLRWIQAYLLSATGKSHQTFVGWNLFLIHICTILSKMFYFSGGNLFLFEICVFFFSFDLSDRSWTTSNYTDCCDDTIIISNKGAAPSDKAVKVIEMK